MGQVQRTLADKTQQFAQAAQQLKEGAAITLQAPYFISFYPKYKEIEIICTILLPYTFQYYTIMQSY